MNYHVRPVWVLLIALFLVPFARADIQHPHVKWAFQTEGFIRGSAAIAGDSLYFGSADGFLYAVSKADGQLRWKFQTGGAIAGAPAIAGSIVIVAGRGDTVYAIDAADGSPRWSFRMQPMLPTLTEWNYFTAPPVVSGDQVLVASGDGHLYSLALETGKKSWAFKTDDSIRAAPLVAGDVVYQPSGDDHVYAIGRSKGELRWKYATAGVGYDLSQGYIRSDIFTRPSLQDGLLVFGSRDANVYAIDVETHEKKWTFAYDSTWAMTTTVDDGMVYVGWSTNNKINALDLATGVKKWEFDAGSHTYTTALVVGQHTYWASANGQVHKLDKKTGALKWSYAVGADVYSSLIHEDGTLYFGTDDGRMLAVSEDSPQSFRAVYLPENIPPGIRGFIVDAKLGPYLVERGYELLNSARALSEWIRAHTAEGTRSVVVFGFAQIPTEVMGVDPARGLLRGYLASGGKVVWPWGMPNRIIFDDKGEFTGFDPTIAARLLEIEFLEFEDTGNYYSRATQTGRNWGMPVWLKTCFASVKSDKGITVLATDEYGRVGAFVKTFHPRIGSGWVAFRSSGFGVTISTSELNILERVASYTME